jgi:hypothetical protein
LAGVSKIEVNTPSSRKRAFDEYTDLLNDIPNNMHYQRFNTSHIKECNPTVVKIRRKEE